MDSVGHAAEISAGITPLRYDSIGSSLMTLAVEVPSVLPMIRRTPRKRSYAEGVDHSCSVAPLPGRIRMLLDAVPLWSEVPSTAVTDSFQVVAVVVTVGVNRSFASMGKVLATPSIVHV